MSPLFRFFILGLLLPVVAACGGHSGGGGVSAAPAPVVAAPLSNFTTVTVDAGPPILATGANGFISDNLAFVTVTLCAPGTTQCQTIDHVEVDTGSVGLRIVQSVLDPALLAALPHESDASANPLGECFQYVDGYVFGSVRKADFKIGGEAVSAMPLQLIGDTGVFATTPSACSAGGGANLTSVQSLGANGIIGLGVTTTDCGTACTTPGGYGAAIYYDCPASGCGAIVSEASSASAPFQQVPNPVAAMAVDNNGVVISLPSAPADGEASLTGTLYFGIGTQTNNGLGSAQVLSTTTSAGPDGAGLVTATYRGQSLPDSFLDSGTNVYLFVDDVIPLCTDADYSGYYCPPSPLQLSPTIVGLNGAAVDASFTLNNAQALLSTTGTSVLPGVGANPTAQNVTNAYPASFDFGLPFFYGRRVYTAIEGRQAGGVMGPYLAY